MEAGIYQIVNIITQKRYIGYTNNFSRRKRQHYFELSFNKHSNEYLQRAWNKYGKHSFEFSIIEKCEETDLVFKEDYWVKVLMTENREYGYNLKPTDPKGKSKHSIETIEKIKKANKCQNNTGKNNGFYGKKLSEQHKEKLKRSREKLDFKKIHREKRGKKVLNIDTGEIYKSLTEAAEIFNIKKTRLSEKLLGKRPNKLPLKYIN